MTNKEAVELLRTFGAENPYRLALNRWLEDLRETEVISVAQPNLPNEALHYNAGRLAMIMDVAASLDGLAKTRAK